MHIENFRQNKIIWYGRYLDIQKNQQPFKDCPQSVRFFSYSASGFCFVLKGKKAAVKILSDSKNWDDTTKGVIGIFISKGNNIGWSSLNNEPDKRIVLTKPENEINLFESEKEETITIRVLKLSEAAFGYSALKELKIEGKIIQPENSDKEKSFGKIEFIGDSITCGYGIEGGEGQTFTTQQERADKAYAFLTAKMLNAEIQNCCWSGIGTVSNWVEPAEYNLPQVGWLINSLWLYSDKSVSERLKIEPEFWEEKKFSPDIVVINIGTNDTSFVQKYEDRRLEYLANYRSLIEAIHMRSPKAKIFCCLGAMGQELCDTVSEAVSSFKKNFPSIKIKALKFPLQDEAKDGIGTDWHPSAKTHLKMAKLLSKELRKFI